MSIRIKTDTAYSNYVAISLADLIALINSDSLSPGVLYQVSFIDAATWQYDIIGYFFATSVNTIDPSGTALFYNADYNNTGIYTNPALTGVNLGIWNTTLAPNAGDVCIWNNAHFENITGANGATNPVLDAVNWTILTRETQNGYLLNQDEIIYNINLDKIVYRFNDAYINSYTGYDSINLFKWGASDCTNNIVINSICENCNNDEQFNNNSITINSSIIIYNNNSITNCNFISSNLNLIASTDIDNVFSNSSFNNCVIISINTCQIDICSLFDCNFNGFNSLISNNVNYSSVILSTGANNTFNNCNIYSTNFGAISAFNLVDCIINNCLFAGSSAFVANNTSFINCDLQSNAPGATTQFINCTFDNFNKQAFATWTPGNFEKCSFLNNEILIRFIITFDGNPGSGQIGNLTVPVNPIPENYICYQFIYSEQIPLVSVGGNINAGNGVMAGTELLNNATGAVATINAAPNLVINANNTTPGGANGYFNMSVNTANVTNGVLNCTAIFKGIR